jgi:hypothetical protein
MYMMRLQHEAAARSQDALQQAFFCGDEELDRVETFNTWAEFWSTTTMTPRRCEQILKRHGHVGHGYRKC